MILMALIIAGGVGLGWLTHRSHRRCIACKELFATVAERVRHERKAHGVR